VDTVKQRTGVNIGPLVFGGSIHKRLGGRLRFLASGSAALPPEVARQFFNFGLLLIQGYGMSETSPIMAVQEASRFKFLFTRSYERRLGSVGQPVDGLDARLADVPDKHIFVEERGEGELLVRGPNVMAGYFRNEPATQAAFVDEGGLRWLHTGDIARFDAQGHLYITGRAKDVIVLASGEKVYPDELEEKLVESPLVAELAVVGRVAMAEAGVPRTAQPPGGAAEALGKLQVWAVVFPSYQALHECAEREGQALTAESARRWLVADLRRIEQDIAPYKRLSEIALVDTPLPKTPLRKVKRFEVTRLLAEGRPDFDLDRLKVASEATAAPVGAAAS
jgi:long-chain acyl-CoA synthetase